MASTVSILIAARDATQRAFNSVRAGARRMGRDVERAAHRMADDGERSFRRLSAVGTQLIGAMAAASVRSLSNLGDAAVSAAGSVGKIGVAAVGVLGILVPLMGVIGSLLGALILIPGMALTGAAAIGVLTLGFQGLGDALSAGLEGDVEKFDAALKKLAPNAQTFVKTLVRMAPAWRAVRAATQQALFAGADVEISRLSGAMHPLAMKWLPAIAAGFSASMRELTRFLSETATVAKLDGIMASVTKTLTNMSGTLKPLAQAFVDVATVGTPRLEGMSASVKGLAERFAAWIREAAEDGRLQRWLDEAMQTLGQLKEIGGNLGEIFGAFFKGGKQSGQDLLETLKDLTQATADWLNSERGQDFISTMGEMIGLIVQITGLTLALIAVWQSWYAVIRAVWTFFATYAMYAIGVVLSGLVKILGWVPGLGGALRTAQAHFTEFATKVTRDLNGIPDVDVYVNVIKRDFTGGMGSNEAFNARVGRRPHGGISGGPTLINDGGRPEVVRLPSGSMVYPSVAQADAAGGRSGGGVATQIVVSVAPGASDQLSAALLNVLRFEVRTNGGTAAGLLEARR